MIDATVHVPAFCFSDGAFEPGPGRLVVSGLREAEPDLMEATAEAVVIDPTVDIALLEQQLGAASQAQRPALLCAMAWGLRQRDSRRAHGLTEEACALLAGERTEAACRLRISSVFRACPGPAPSDRVAA